MKTEHLFVCVCYISDLILPWVTEAHDDRFVAGYHSHIMCEVFSFTLSLRTEQNLCSGQLAAMAYALRSLPTIAGRNVAVVKL